jgi:hypothetical protein
MYRWLLGLAPTWDDGEDFQECAMLAAWNSPDVVPNSHNPPPTAKCYTLKGAGGVASSNLSWGMGHPAHSIDQFMEDYGNETTFGHRRWLMEPWLAPIQIGYWSGGGTWGSAQCTGVFGNANSGPAPSWMSFPPPGYVPINLLSWDWTFHGPGASTGAMSVTRNGQPVPMKKMPLSPNYGSYEAVAYRREGWVPEPGDTLEISFTFSTPVTFQIKPIACNP